MKTITALFFFFLPGLVSAQTVWATNRESGKQIEFYPKKIKTVVSKDGEFFEGKVRPTEEYLEVAGTRIPYESIGFLEVKRITSRGLVSGPLKFLGGALLIVGGAMVAVPLSQEGDPEFPLLIAGTVVAGTGFALFSVGKKTSPGKSEKITVLHLKDWQFSYGRDY